MSIANEIIHYLDDPLGYVHDFYDWGNGTLKNSTGPRQWQCDILTEIREHLQDKSKRFTPLRVAVASGHGIGKSALVGMITNWGLTTCDDTRIIVTANTETQLRTKTWPELIKWTGSSRSASMWSNQAMSITSTQAGHDKSWRADAVPWSENNTEAFAGLHNMGKRIILIFDESSAIADKVWDVAEGALTDENTEIIWLAFGNPTRNTGRFRECFRKYKHLWKNFQIDSRSVEGTNKEYLDEFVQTHGVDSDTVKIRVRGMFPSSSSRQFISEEDVDAALSRELKEHQFNFAPKIITVDPAWEGDDALIIAMRQGLMFKILRKMPKNDNDNQIGAIVAQLEDEHQADAVVIDQGYGTGIVSYGRTIGRHWHCISFASASSDPGCLNKRAEMWQSMKQWLKEGGAIPPDNELRDELMGPEVVARMDGKIQIESKKDMKKRGLPSPNKADALALSFAVPVRRRSQNVQQKAIVNYTFME